MGSCEESAPARAIEDLEPARDICCAQSQHPSRQAEVDPARSGAQDLGGAPRVRPRRAAHPPPDQRPPPGPRGLGSVPPGGRPGPRPGRPRLVPAKPPPRPARLPPCPRFTTLARPSGAIVLPSVSSTRKHQPLSAPAACASRTVASLDPSSTTSTSSCEAVRPAWSAHAANAPRQAAMRGASLRQGSTTLSRAGPSISQRIVPAPRNEPHSGRRPKGASPWRPLG